MTKDQAIQLIQVYCDFLTTAGEMDDVSTGLASRWPADGSTNKAMRWLGFIQGVMYADGYCTLEDLKAHSQRLVAGEIEDLRVEMLGIAETLASQEDSGAPIDMEL